MKYNKEMYAGYPEQLEHAESVITWQEKEIERLKSENHNLLNPKPGYHPNEDYYKEKP